MTNEDIVLGKIESRVRNRKLSPLVFSNSGYYYNSAGFDTAINNLKVINDIQERIYEIVRLSHTTFGTKYYKNGSFQCRAGARRSVLDIIRIYKYYFEEIDLFTVMRTLHKLVTDAKLSTMKCPDIHKQVFWNERFNNNYSEYYELTELGIKFEDWKEIGLNYEAQKIS